MRSVKLMVTIACILFMAIPIMSRADVPQMINYQGRLTDSTGGPVKDSTYMVTFTIYNQAEGGLIIWLEEDTIVTNNGLFSTMLGDNISLHENIFEETPRYLGIQIHGQGEIYPRTALISVPYAFHAANADTADYAMSGIGNGWVDDGNIVRLEDGNDSVGIGTVEPFTRLHVYDSTDNYAIPHPLLTLHAHSTGTYIEGFGPQITFRADDNGGNDFEFGRLSAVKDYYSTNFARFEWSILANGVMSPFMTLGTEGGLAVNNPSNYGRERGLFEVRNYAANRCVAGFGSDISENNVYIDYTGDPGDNPEASFLTMRTHTDSVPITKFKFLANGNLIVDGDIRSNILMDYGYEDNVPECGTRSVVFNVTFSAPPSVVVGYKGDEGCDEHGNWFVFDVTTTGFTIRNGRPNQPAGRSCYWIAMGPGQ